MMPGRAEIKRQKWEFHILELQISLEKIKQVFNSSNPLMKKAWGKTCDKIFVEGIVKQQY